LIRTRPLRRRPPSITNVSISSHSVGRTWQGPQPQPVLATLSCPGMSLSTGLLITRRLRKVRVLIGETGLWAWKAVLMSRAHTKVYLVRTGSTPWAEFSRHQLASRGIVLEVQGEPLTRRVQRSTRGWRECWVRCGPARVSCSPREFAGSVHAWRISCFAHSCLAAP
jgi:hypothetical protein